VKLFPNKTSFATGSDDGSARLFDIRAVDQLNVYQDQEDPNEGPPPSVNRVAFNSSGSIIYTGCSDGSVCGWYTLSGFFFHELESHNHCVEAIELSPDGKAICTAGREPVDC
jgi:WD40 repeat protein